MARKISETHNNHTKVGIWVTKKTVCDVTLLAIVCFYGLGFANLHTEEPVVNAKGVKI